MKIQQLSKYVYIADQVNTSDIETLKALGIHAVINNRPDNEEVGQPLSDELSKSMKASGIEYAYLPITPCVYTETNIEEFSVLFNAMKKPILLFCRTGNRAVNLWALSQMNKYGKKNVIDKAKNIGFDVALTINNY
ncbi:TIGR01244 family sulfur transferase [Thalassotalea piscium]